MGLHSYDIRKSLTLSLHHTSCRSLAKGIRKVRTGVEVKLIVLEKESQAEALARSVHRPTTQSMRMKHGDQNSFQELKFASI